MKHAIVVALLAAAALAGCTTTNENNDEQTQQVDCTVADVAHVALCTNFGDMSIVLFHEQAPITANNFCSHVKTGYYDGLVFHRIIRGFMMQGGDPEGTGGGGEAFGGGTIPLEIHPQLRHDEIGTLSMARTPEPDSAGSQFFITFGPTPQLDGTPGAGNGYAVFGRVVHGLAVVKDVENEASAIDPASNGVPPAKEVKIHRAVLADSDDACPNFVEPEPPGPPALVSDAITAGEFHVTDTTDQILVWTKNDGDEGTDAVWSLTGADGVALPDGWEFSFRDEVQPVGPQGAPNEAVFTMLTLMVPPEADGAYELELGNGMTVAPLTVNVALSDILITRQGDPIIAQYAGTCVADGSAFDSGDFDLSLGGGRAIAGFDWGLIGVQDEETVTITIPAAMAYGHNGGPCGGMDPADLQFVVTVLMQDA